jgi:hypothetical protein
MSSVGSTRTSGGLGQISKANLSGLSSSVSENKRGCGQWGHICIAVAQQFIQFLIH